MTRHPSSPYIGIWKRLNKSDKVQLLVRIDAYDGSSISWEDKDHVVKIKEIRDCIRGKAKHRIEIIGLATLEVV